MSTTKLDNDQLSQVQQALLGAFDRDSLRMMLRLELNVDLDTVAGDDELAIVVFNLIEWAERTGQVGELIAGATRYNPGNGELKQVADAYAAWNSEPVREQESPVPVPVAETKRGPRWIIATAIIAGLAILVGLYLFSRGIGFGMSSATTSPSASPAGMTQLTPPDATSDPETQPEPMRAAEPANSSDPASVPSFTYTFDEGDAAGWTGDTAFWTVLRAENGNYVYQGQADGGADAAIEPPAKDAMARWTDYAVDLRVRALAPVTDSDLAELWLSIRASYEAGSVCDAYNVYLDFLPQTVTAHKVCDSRDQPLQRNGFSLQLGDWYDMRVEVQGDNLHVWIDEVPLIVAQDGDIAQGYLYFNVGPGATVQLDDIRIYKLLPEP